MLTSLRSKISLREQLGMAMMSLGLLGVVLMLMSFTQGGLEWWYSLGWPLGLDRGVVVLAAASLFLMCFGGMHSVGCRDATLTFLIPMFIIVMLSGVASMLITPVASSSSVNVGIVSLYRAQRMEEVLADRVAMLEHSPAPSRGNRAVLAEIAQMHAALAAPTHKNLHQAYSIMAQGTFGVELSRAMDASAVLGLSEHSVVQAARLRGWMRPAERQTLDRTAQQLVIASDVSKWSLLQQSAFIALTQEGGLREPLSLGAKEKS